MGILKIRPNKVALATSSTNELISIINFENSNDKFFIFSWICDLLKN